MGWATRIEVDGRRLMARVATPHGASELVPLDALAAVGAPEEHSANRRVTTDMRCWSKADTATYLRAFDADANQNDRHEVFRIEHDDTVVLLPALVLMRAMFRPARYLLQTMFLPHALDSVCHLHTGRAPASLVMTAHWASPGRASRYADVSSALLWMKCFPTAMTMAASVHEFAMRGAIGLQLPDAKCEMLVRGKLVDGVLHATQATIFEVCALEEPLPFASGLSRRVVFHGKWSGQVNARKTRALPDNAIPRHSDGSVAVSDEEWRRIEPVVVSRGRHRPVRLDQRQILNGVLTKLAYGIPWAKVPYSVGTWSNAFYAHRTWSSRGAFDRALNILKRTRATEPADALV